MVGCEVGALHTFLPSWKWAVGGANTKLGCRYETTNRAMVLSRLRAPSDLAPSSHGCEKIDREGLFSPSSMHFHAQNTTVPLNIDCPIATLGSSLQLLVDGKVQISGAQTSISIISLTSNIKKSFQVIAKNELAD
eukprot:scaffold5317_cov160-Amphora_coffeaeformis.AAC.3